MSMRRPESTDASRTIRSPNPPLSVPAGTSNLKQRTTLNVDVVMDMDFVGVVDFEGDSDLDLAARALSRAIPFSQVRDS